MTAELELPGFRFHPTEDELLNFYLKNMVLGKKIHYDIIGLLNIYHHDPWDLPGLSKVGEREWYFFVPRDRKHGSGGRPKRTTEHGFWKATGSDRKIVSISDPKRIIGLKKTLVFYEGRAPKGHKTDWVMNEYRLPDGYPLPKDIVLCKIYRKATSLKVLEQRAMEEDQMKTIQESPSPPSTSLEAISFCGQQEEVMVSVPLTHVILKQEEQEVIMVEEANITDQGKAAAAKDHQKKGSSMSLQLPLGKTNLPELQVPKMNNMDWTQDPVWSQFSPWLQNLTQNFTPSYANVLNF